MRVTIVIIQVIKSIFDIPNVIIRKKHEALQGVHTRAVTVVEFHSEAGEFQ